METHGLPKWAIPAAIAGIVLLLVLRGKGGAGASTAGAGPAADPLRAAADQLQQQKNQADAQRANALANIDTTAQADQQVLIDCKKLFADPAFACPGGGRPRVVVVNQWPGVACGCIAPRTGALTLGSVAQFAAGLYKSFGLGGGGGGGGGGYYGGDYNASNDTAAPGATSQPYGPGLGGVTFDGNLPV